MTYNEFKAQTPDGTVRDYLAYCRENGMRAKLSGAKLSGANLSGANLYDADLREADLSEADLSGADLGWANLYDADLREADLSLANLSRANLSGAKLSGADLSGAKLSGAVGPFTVFAAGAHTAIFCGGNGSIGCEFHGYDVWLADYEVIGRRNGYNDEQIADYGELIRFAVARQRRIESAVLSGGEGE